MSKICKWCIWPIFDPKTTGGNWYVIHPLSNLKIPYPKQFGFQKSQSIDHPLLQLVDQIYESFECNEYTIVVFIELSKTFDTVDHNILLKKLEISAISGTHPQWFRNCLSNRKHYIQFGGWQKANYKTVKCGVSQVSILEYLLFLSISTIFSSLHVFLALLCLLRPQTCPTQTRI